MHRLSRIVRVALGPQRVDLPPSAGNGLVAVVFAAGLAPVVELEVECAGRPADTGYLVDITVIDRAVRDHLVPILRRAMQADLAGAATDLRTLLAECAAALEPALPVDLSALTYRPSPFRSASVERASSRHPPTQGSPAMPDAFILTETFEFAASHRLHLPERSDAENRSLFGKCNNPNGHGHNYRIEVAVEVGSGAAAGLDFAAIESMVQTEVMARFDHKHLNLDCPEFKNLNPSVENIARVCHELLAPRVRDSGGTLRFVRVWETDKTSCRYPA